MTTERPAALILAAGLATRLPGLRDQYAKCCVPVADTTPLRFLLEALSAGGWQEVWINLHHRGQQVRREAERHAPPGMRLRFLEEERLLGTGGTLLEAEGLGARVGLVVNAKLFTDFDFALLREAAPGTMVLHEASPVSVFGGLRRDAQGRISDLVTRPPANRPGSRDGADGVALPVKDAAVYTGICTPHPEWLPLLAAARAKRPDATLCLVRDALLPAVRAGVTAHALMHEGWWSEISTPERLAACVEMLRRSAPADSAAAGSARSAP